MAAFLEELAAHVHREMDEGYFSGYELEYEYESAEEEEEEEDEPEVSLDWVIIEIHEYWDGPNELNIYEADIIL